MVKQAKETPDPNADTSTNKEDLSKAGEKILGFPVIPRMQSRC